MNRNIIFSAIVIVVFGLLFYGFINESNKETSDEGNATTTESYGENIIETLDIQDKNKEEEINNEVMINKKEMSQVKIETNKGEIVIELYENDAPNTVANFIKLASEGFYNGVIFHRVISGFMIQGGDPTGTGSGGPGYKFADELDPNTESAKAGYKRGAVAMANAGPNTNGSQFFIMHADYPLPHNYTIFGKVVSGMEVVDAIASTETGTNDRPIEEVKMTKVSVL